MKPLIPNEETESARVRFPPPPPLFNDLDQKPGQQLGSSSAQLCPVRQAEGNFDQDSIPPSPAPAGQKVASRLCRPYLWPHDYGDWKNILRGPRYKAFEPPGRSYLNGTTQYCQRSAYRRDFRVILAYQREWQ